jgi:HK97 family phage prohead protease
MNHRAWSKFTLKSLSDELRVLEGVASTPTPDRMEDIVEPLGAQFELPLPFLWQHDSEQPVGHVTHATAGTTGITVRVQIAKSDEPGLLKDRLDMAWQSIKAKLVRGLSIGFAPLESSYIEKTGGYHFKRWEWLELSAVTIPANVEASIAVIKSCDSRMIRLSKNRPVIRLAAKNRPMIRLAKRSSFTVAARIIAAKNRPVIRLPQQ